MDINNPNLKYWLAFANSESLGSVSITKLWKYYGCIKEAWNAPRSEILEIPNLGTKRIESFIEGRKKTNPDELLEEVIENKINIITIEDEDYPRLLKQIYDPPAVIYYKGDLKNINLEKTLAVVGSRKHSHYIKETLPKILSGLTGSNITIISGMALGIDTIAHRASLDFNIKTVAVLGSGLNNIYPKQNKDLFKEILEKEGVVMSEYPLYAEPIAYRFPLRNRIVSGLSKGTLVAEASLKSGALITARLCLEHHRELMAIPGMVGCPTGAGVNKILKEGAGIVTEAQDIIDYLDWAQTAQAKTNKPKDLNLEENEAKLYEVLSLEPLSIDKILDYTKLTIGDLMMTLTSLELKGIIKQVSGDKYIKTLR